MQATLACGRGDSKVQDLACETLGAAIAASARLAKPNVGGLYVAKFENQHADLCAERCRICVSYVVPPTYDWAPGWLSKESSRRTRLKSDFTAVLKWGE
jgi:hypothetical protein